MSQEIESSVYDTRDNQLVGVIKTDGVKVTSFDAKGTPDMAVLGLTAGFVSQYRNHTYGKEGAGMPYPKALYEALLHAAPTYATLFIKTVTL